MEKRTTYVGTLNGAKGLWCGFKPEGLEVEEEREVLYADEGKVLKNKKTGDISDAVWLKDGDVQENYEEIEYTEEPEETEE